MNCIDLVLTAILFLNPNWSEAKAKKYATPICLESERRSIDPIVIVSIIQHETNWKIKSNTNKNGSVDYGIMQFNCSSLEKIHMKWRKRRCSNIKKLMTIEGGIAAGVEELSFWKNICFKKHKTIEYILRLKFIKVLEYINNIIVLSDSCDSCSRRLYNYIIFLKQKILLKLLNIRKDHWWIQHYNWKSKQYSLRIMYIYIVLRLNLKDNYQIIRTRHYAKFRDLAWCLKQQDLCLEEYEKWHQRKKKKSLRR